VKQAHIVTELHEVGDKVIAICGEKHRVKVKWADVPDDKPICRTCVDVAVKALDEADALIERARRRSVIFAIHLERLTEELEPDLLLLDSIAEANQEYRDQQEARINRKYEKKRAKRTCTCTWKTMEDFVVDPKCPIHGPIGDERAIEDTELPEHDVPTPGSVQRNGDE
jgi:hypothetical protein